ncbi:unnamed protein product [Auanema sp. JU1783]|nr:unnamed protein product [Auanema sp. JU1783]
MGKHEKGAPKDLANRSKSRGLAKLRWYCEMCKKQCRDANGYKCHLTSESHQRQLILVAEDTDAYIRQFSREFEEKFIFVLKNSYGCRRVRANEVYQEYIKDKDHTHMNATRWHTLTGFIHFLAEIGKVKIDKDEEKGVWYVQYIDQEHVVKKQEEERKQKAEKDDEDRQLQMIKERVQRALDERGEDDESYEPTALVRNEDEKISLNINFNTKPTLEELNKPMAITNIFEKKINAKKEEPDSDDDREKRKSHKNEKPVKRERSRSPKDRSSSRDDRRNDKGSKRSALEDIRMMNERIKERNNRKDYWLHEGIVVKIVTKKLGSEFYKEKGVVKSLVDQYTANVKLSDGVIVKLDQTHVETVIPQVGRDMMIVNGAYRGQKAILEAIDEKKFSLNLRIKSGVLNGREVNVPYEDASKLA